MTASTRALTTIGQASAHSQVYGTQGLRATSRAPAWLPIVGLAAALGFAVLWGVAVAMGDMAAFFLCASAIGFIAICFDFRIGVVLLMLVMPISETQIFPHAMFGITGLNPLNVLMIGTLGSWFLHSLARRRNVTHFIPARLLWLLIVPFVAAGILGMRHIGDIPSGVFEEQALAFSSGMTYMRDMVIKPLLLVMFGLLVGAAVFWSDKPDRFVTPLIVSAWIMALLVLGYVVAADVDIRQLAGARARHFLSPLGLHANDLGRLYATAYALLLFIWARTDNPRLGMPLLATMAVVVGALLLTFSRGAFLGFVIVNVLFLMSSRNAKTVFIAGCMALGLIAVGGIVLARMSSGMSGDMNSVSAGRIELIWLPLLPEIFRSPLVGSGVSSILWSEAMRNDAMHTVTHPHNAYLRALLDMGVVGLVLLCLYQLHVWRGFRSLARDPKLSPTMRGLFEGAAAGLVSLLIAGMAGSALTPVPEQAFLWLSIGLMYGIFWKRRMEARAQRAADKAAERRAAAGIRPVVRPLGVATLEAR
jgi:hypothetical protein